MSNDRYAEERRQGERIARGDLEHVWGWSGPAGQLRAERRASFLIEAAGLAPGVRCLELGCGTGEFTTRLVESGCALVGVELSEATAAIARERVDGRAEIVVGNVETGEGIEGSFDAIVGVSVLHHVDLEATLEHTFAHLRPGGRFAFSEPNIANPQVWAERAPAPPATPLAIPPAPTPLASPQPAETLTQEQQIEAIRRRRHVTSHETAFRTGELRARLERAGFLVEVCEPFEFLHPATPGPLVGAVSALERVVERTPLRAVAASIRVAGRRPLEHDEAAERGQPA